MVESYECPMNMGLEKLRCKNRHSCVVCRVSCVVGEELGQLGEKEKG
jgi:hypothetical protein